MGKEARQKVVVETKTTVLETKKPNLLGGAYDSDDDDANEGGEATAKGSENKLAGLIPDIDGAPIDEDIDGEPLDVDGEPVVDDDLDGVPIG